jgi:cytidylate kinase
MLEELKMGTRVVTISHATGAVGDSIGRSVAERLGFRYVDEEIIEIAAKKHGLDADLVADAERRKNLFSRLLDDLATAPMLDPSGTAGFLMADTTSVPRREELRQLIIEAIRETAQRGDVVIVSHAAGIPLAGRDDLLRVLVSASFDTRVQRLAAARRVAKGEADKLLKGEDAGRADYFLRFYKIERELPTQYDLVINTDKLSPEEATDIVVAAAKRKS